MNIPFTEVQIHSVNMIKLVSLLFATSRTAAKKLIQSGAVEVVERNTSDKRVQERRVAGETELLFVEAKETQTLIRKGREWKRVIWEVGHEL